MTDLAIREPGLLLGHSRAVRAAFVQQWKLMMRSHLFLSQWTLSLPYILVVGWIAARSDDPAVLDYVAVGAFLSMIWNASVFQMGYSLNVEFFLGTFEPQIASRTPVMVTMLGKCIAIIVLSCTSGVVAAVTILVLAQRVVDVASVPLLLVSLACVMFALFASAFILSPLMVLTRARAGVPNLFTWAGVILGGLLFPVSLLPMGVELVARLLPTSWAMEAVIRSMDGGASVVWIAARWTIALGLTVIYLGMAGYLFAIVMRRVRISGTLSTF